MAEAFNPYHKWLGIPPEDQPADHYRLLAIELFEPDPDVIAAAADICLLNAERKAGYDWLLPRQTQAKSAAGRINGTSMPFNICDYVTKDWEEPSL